MIKEIEFVLENCDTITIAGKDIAFADISLLLNLPKGDRNMFRCGLSKRANVEKCPFNNEDFRPYRIFDRLKKNDITAITIIRDDEPSLIFETNYREKSNMLGSANFNQETIISGNGDLYISVPIL